MTDDLNDLTARGEYALPTNPSATPLAGTLDELANGLTSDRNGRLYIAAANGLDLNEYFISTDIAPVLASDPGINDVALPALVQQTTPEPGGLRLLGTGVIGLAGALRRGFKV